MTAAIVEQIRAEYERLRREKGKVTAPDIHMLAAQYYHQVKTLPKHKLLRACEQLLDAGFAAIPFDWLFRIRTQFVKTDFRRLELWLATYVDDWGKCDDLCVHALGAFLFQFPDLIPRTDRWTGSSNRWVRRASAVALIYGLRRKQDLASALARADALLTDGDDMVQKGYGWMLKEAANHFPQEVFDFVMARKDRMPRTALRYAIEKMPPEWKSAAMKRAEP
ncbi:MAG: DNA alkylation repair protein [candidate division Zixibacteria bacterium]|nr:DNA alkylation repair protein [candidate division Zixibacteria bacterium]